MRELTIHNKRGISDYTLTLNFTFPFVHFQYFDNQNDTHISKKQKTSSLMNNHQNTSSSSSNSRINLYPEPNKQVPREIHAFSRGNKLQSVGNFFIRTIIGKRVLGSKGFLEKFGENKQMEKNTAPSRGYKLGLAELVSDCSDMVSEDEVLNDKKGYRLRLMYERTKKCAIETIRSYKKDDKVGFVTEVIDLDREDDSDEEIFENGAMGSEVEDASKILETLLLDSDDDSALQLSMHKNLLRESFVPLTNEEKDVVYRAFSASNRRKVLVIHENSNVDITGDVLQCLSSEEWLNDEVINVYFQLLKERENREPMKFLKCHFFNTFFYKKLIGGKSGYDYKSVRRWTAPKKLGYSLSECDKIFVPIHKQAHWCLAVINKKEQKFQYLDSLGGTDTNVLRVLAMYYVDELKDKNGLDIDVVSWTQEHVKDIPVQKNGWDCGMFMIKYADFYSRGVGLRFNQEHMPYFRLRTAKEILRLEAK